MPLRLLITGASGLLGLEISRIALRQGYDVYSAYHKHNRTFGKPIRIDVRKYGSVEKVFDEIDPDLIVHAAALTDVDQCEQNRKLAWAVNVQGTENIVEQVDKHKSFFVYISTDYVFSGERGLYTESDRPHPVNYYGKTKLKAEQVVRKSLNEWCVARSSVIFGAHPVADRHNFALWVISKLQRREMIEIVSDQWVSPTLSTNLAEMILEVADRRLTGIYNLAGASRVSRLDFAQVLADAFMLDKNMIKTSTVEKIDWIAKRPRDSSLNVSKAAGLLSKKPMEIDKAVIRLKNEHGESILSGPEGMRRKKKDRSPLQRV